MPQPKAIFFDLDETLAENIIPIQQLFAEMYYQFSSQLGAGNQTAFFDALRENASSLWRNMFDSSTPPEELFIDCFARSIESLDCLARHEVKSLAVAMFDRFKTLSTHNVRLQDGARETLAALNKVGFVTGIITNGMEQIQLGKIYQLNLHTQVDHVIVSAQARAHKPHAKVFQHALQLANVKAEQAWQVGDNATNDVAGAIRVGMSGVFFDPTRTKLATAFTDLSETPTHVVHHLSEVLELAQSVA